MIEVVKKLATEDNNLALVRKVTEELEKLPQLEMYPERKQVFHIISEEQNDGLVKLVDCLCNQYKQLYIKCRGKDA